jgi:hypothetical protein
MINKIKKTAGKAVGTIAGLGYLFAAKVACADTAGITEQTADTVGEKIVDIASEIIMPLGSAVIFISIAIAAFKIITTSNKPEDRASAIGSLPYILGGGLLLGGAMVAAGFVIGLMTKAGQ